MNYNNVMLYINGIHRINLISLNIIVAERWIEWSYYANSSVNSSLYTGYLGAVVSDGWDNAGPGESEVASGCVYR